MRDGPARRSTRAAACRSAWPRIVIALSMTMTAGEFIEIQRLPPQDLRARFKLPAACEPSMTALNTEAERNRMTVEITCRARAQAVPEPRERRLFRQAPDLGG